MAQAVLHTLAKAGGETKVIEAPTGSGKSMALLIPACLHIQDHPEDKIILTTGTKALQNQLAYKDLPAARRIFKTTQIAVLQGRENYISPGLLNDIGLRHYTNKTDAAHARFLAKNIRPLFAHLTATDGTVEDLKLWWTKNAKGEALSPRVLQEIVTPPKEDMRLESFHQRALLRANQASIVVMNHALMLARSQHCESIWPTPNPGYSEIGETELHNTTPHLLVDECHHLPNVAIEQERVLTTTQEWKDWAELALNNSPTEKHLALSATDTLHAKWAALKPPPEGISPTTDQIELCTKTAEITNNLCEALKESASYGNVDAAQRANKADAVTKMFKRIPSELHNSDTFHNITITKQGFVCFESKPFEAAQHLNKLYAMAQSVVLTSATATFGSETHTRQAYGLDRWDKTHSARTKQNEVTPVLSLPSPFKLKEATRAFVMQGIPTTTEGLPKFAACCKPVIEALKGRTLILFSSYDAMKKTAEMLRGPIEAAGADMLVQSPQMTAHTMAATLRERPNVVLLGTESLRTGIDIPGNHLAAVIIHKLPFGTPDRYADEKTKFVQRTSGRNFFRDIVVPETANSLKQAIGRLIRTTNDTGILIIADDRLVKSSYAQELLTATSAYDWKTLNSPDQLPEPDWIKNHCQIPDLQPAYSR